MNKRFILAISGLLLLTCIGYAQESESNKSNVITIETATIRGNQELPTVLYLVPWQPPQINPLPASQTAEISQQSLEKIDRSSFQRLLHYHKQFRKTQP